MGKNHSKPAGYKEPKIGKYCPKCHNKVACAYQSCPCCAHAFVSVKTTRIIHKPARGKDMKSDDIVSLRKAIKMIRALGLETVEKIMELLYGDE